VSRALAAARVALVRTGSEAFPLNVRTHPRNILSGCPGANCSEFRPSRISEFVKYGSPHSCNPSPINRVIASYPSQEVRMAAAKSKFRSNFGASCVRCSDYLVAPERSEYRYTRHIVHAWVCSKCGYRFEIIVPTGETPPSEIMVRIRDVCARRSFIARRLGDN
jgi:hypothetical protein